ncbi:MAG: fucose isomerase [Armatimonadota bacterium]|nr:MAG: fucose isomerase [Armatimonadota bacterium]
MKIGIVSFTDGRKRVADSLNDACHGFQGDIAKWLKRKGHQVVEGKKIIWNYAAVRSEAARMNRAGCDVVVFNFSVWSFPDLTVQTASLIEAPILCIGNLNPGQPGWVAFFASAGALDEVGIPYGRALGDIKDPRVQAQVLDFLVKHEPDKQAQGNAAAAKLYGQRYGEFDGPSMGMYTGHVDQSQWMAQFGVHVYHRSQLTLVDMAKRVSKKRVQAGLDWLEAAVAKIHWDGDMLTPGLDGTLAKQVRLYLGMKDLCRQEGIDFCGITGQLDLTESKEHCIADVPEALLNDVADWEDDPKKVIVCATECDSNGALTMQILHHLTGTPVLFADLRHYHEKLDVYDLVNSGEHAPYLSKRSKNWRRNWKQVHLMPASKFFFRGGGASVQFYADPADPVTFARITRKNGEFQMHIFTGAFVKLPKATMERLAKQTTYEWPHAFSRFNISYERFAREFRCNHLHAALGDWVGQLIAACEALGIEPIVLD